ncbi:Uncharacterised protein [Kluyvera cryocrescens]|nr:Uncharacterised protein [Kluyvera cryocrescens]
MEHVSAIPKILTTLLTGLCPQKQQKGTTLHNQGLYWLFYQYTLRLLAHSMIEQGLQFQQESRNPNNLGLNFLVENYLLI